MFWLILFGLIHAHVILWIGDILYLYGFCGMIVYLCRKVKPTYLVLGVPLVAVADFTAGTLFYQHIREKRIAYVEASAAAAENKPPTQAQTEALRQWREIEKTLIPNREDAQENTRKMKSSYATVAGRLRPLAWKIETILLPIEIWDSLALMFLGLALYRWGFLWDGGRIEPTGESRRSATASACHWPCTASVAVISTTRTSRRPSAAWSSCPSNGTD